MSNNEPSENKKLVFANKKESESAKDSRTSVSHSLQVLEEDEFISSLDAVIEKDFFPTLKLLKRKNYEVASFEDKLALAQASNICYPESPMSSNFSQINKKILRNKEVSLNEFLDNYTSQDNARYPLASLCICLYISSFFFINLFTMLTLSQYACYCAII
ncbi:hypothetical protein BB561_006758 [Smittium simulii]|uniref:Uncharacterized protein n=1 Tax=Smittium simulii TaxID=133385 RepID=A0A2T9Y1R8_9FUNG|nr:hypothetical protein BB561_006758 [Smittium simulii]